jgi:hypothetical protein
MLLLHLHLVLLQHVHWRCLTHLPLHVPSPLLLLLHVVLLLVMLLLHMLLLLHVHRRSKLRRPHAHRALIERARRSQVRAHAAASRVKHDAVGHARTNK